MLTLTHCHRSLRCCRNRWQRCSPFLPIPALPSANVMTEKSACLVVRLAMRGRLFLPWPVAKTKTNFAVLANSLAKRNSSGNQHGDESSCELGHFCGPMWDDVSKPDLKMLSS